MHYDLRQIYINRINIKSNFSEHVIKVGDGYLKGSTSPMIDLGKLKIQDLNTGKITPE